MVEDTHPPLASHPLAEQALEAYLAGVAAVEPTPLVRRAVRQGHLDDWLGDRERPKRIHVLAVGKAAPRMVWGLVEASVPFVGLGVAPHGVQAPGIDTFEWLAGEHPLPGQASFAAGRRVLDWCAKLPQDAPVLVLLSGGSSALIESPKEGWNQDMMLRRWRELFAQGLAVEDVNVERATMSALKGGGLGEALWARTRNIRVWLVQDTVPEKPEAVGSQLFGVGDDRFPYRVLATNHDLVAAAGLRLATAGWTVYRHVPRIQQDAQQEAEAFVSALASLEGERVALVGGGEPVVRLPPDAPIGGRSQHAALAAAFALRRLAPTAVFAALASDGIDGTTKESGAWSVASDADEEARRALEACDASSLLARRGRTVRLGPTGTNVNDLWLALRP